MARDISETIRNNTEDLFTMVGTNIEKIDEITSAPYSYWRETFKQLFKKPSVYICIIVLFLIVFFTIFGPMIHSFGVDISVTDPDAPGFPERFGETSIPNVFEAVLPNSINWFGVCTPKMPTEYVGLDLWSLVWQGARLSLLLGVVVALIETVIGIVVGALWGYFRWLDPIMIEFSNFVGNIPSLLLFILFMQIFSPYMKDYAFFIIVLLLTMFSWMGLASVIRNQIIIIRNREYNIASQTLGSSASAMVTHNLLPYIISIIVSSVSLSIPAAIGAEVGLSFFSLSFNMKYGDITLGQVLTAATQTTHIPAEWMTYPFILIAPLVVLAPITICFYYLGIALADASDPKRHR